LDQDQQVLGNIKDRNTRKFPEEKLPVFDPLEPSEKIGHGPSGVGLGLPHESYRTLSS